MRPRLSFALALLASTAVAQPPQPGSGPPVTAPGAEVDRGEIVNRLADALEANFVFPEVARRYATALRAKAAAGGYAGLGSPQAFAEALTADLQSIYPDRHLRVLPPPGAAPSPGAGPGPRLRPALPDPSDFAGESGWIADGVAYIDLHLFPGTEASLDAIRRFMGQHGNARAVIFDLRTHHGGGIAEMNVIFSYLIANETPLIGTDTRRDVDARARRRLEVRPMAWRP